MQYLYCADDVHLLSSQICVHKMLDQCIDANRPHLALSHRLQCLDQLHFRLLIWRLFHVVHGLTHKSLYSLAYDEKGLSMVTSGATTKQGGPMW